MEIENELGGRGEEEQSVQWSVHTRVQPSCITQVLLLVHKEACTRMHSVETEKEFGGKGGGGAKRAMHCVHTCVQTVMHRMSELMVHKEACTRMCTMEMAKELRGVEQSKQCIARTRVCNPRASHK